MGATRAAGRMCIFFSRLHRLTQEKRKALLKILGHLDDANFFECCDFIKNQFLGLLKALVSGYLHFVRNELPTYFNILVSLTCLMVWWIED